MPGIPGRAQRQTLRVVSITGSAPLTRPSRRYGVAMSSAAETEFSIAVAESAEGVVTVALVGELDLSHADDVTERLGALAAGGPVSVVVDLSSLVFVDSSGLNALSVGARAVMARNGSIVFAGANAHVARVFEIVRFADALSVEASVARALDRARSEAAAPG
jgi:anti-sigma B factor antagonist